MEIEVEIKSLNDINEAYGRALDVFAQSQPTGDLENYTSTSVSLKRVDAYAEPDFIDYTAVFEVKRKA